MMDKYICGSCLVAMRPDKNGVDCVSMVQGQPYEWAQGDRWICLLCGQKIIAGFGNTVEQHAPQFKALAAGSTHVYPTLMDKVIDAAKPHEPEPAVANH